jgi:hypothetical protein
MLLPKVGRGSDWRSAIIRVPLTAVCGRIVIRQWRTEAFEASSQLPIPSELYQPYRSSSERPCAVSAADPKRSGWSTVGLLGHLTITTAGVWSVSMRSTVIVSYPLIEAEASSVTCDKDQRQHARPRNNPVCRLATTAVTVAGNRVAEQRSKSPLSRAAGRWRRLLRRDAPALLHQARTVVATAPPALTAVEDIAPLPNRYRDSSTPGDPPRRARSFQQCDAKVLTSSQIPPLDTGDRCPSIHFRQFQPPVRLIVPKNQLGKVC